MDDEFHYYITYLIAARAGFVPEHARKIAYAAQLVDDNCEELTIHGSRGSLYRNYISQTMNILRPRENLLRIYPVFHFVPGDPNAETARRKDGRTNPWMTTPDNQLARHMLKSALELGCLYRIGIAAHAYVDTWAHQNFIGKFDDLNGNPSLSTFSPLRAIDVGHGSFEHQPDMPALIWTDERLVVSHVDNRGRFLDAASALYTFLVADRDPTITRHESILQQNIRKLRSDINDDIGLNDPHSKNYYRTQRIKRYKARTRQPEYGGQVLPAYDKDKWFKAAIDIDFLQNERRYSWKDKDSFEGTDWYTFSEAIKAHQKQFWAILKEQKLPDLDSPRM